ncbi:MAG: polymerase sigma-70 factor [Mucilaginibacter sp.]|nr:polymerase sigma-70 factor [Mucilaginibacter sp.]
MLKNTPTDSELWEAIQLNDNKAFNLLFERYWTAIYRTAYDYLPDDVVCLEIVNDIFLRIWQKRHELQIALFKSYLTSAARYHVYKELKARNKELISYMEDYTYITEKVLDMNDGEKRIQSSEFQSKINDLLEQLPQRCREIFMLSREQHLSNNEISERLGISKRSVENQLTSALKHLRNSIKHLSVFILLYLLK